VTALLNVPAILVVAAVTTLLVIGVKESANVNSTTTILKVAALLAFIVAGTGFLLNHPDVFRANWKEFIPPNAVLGGYYAQAINKNAPHPAAARLWEEFLYSQGATGGQNLWIEGGARPVEQAAMTSNGSINTSAASKLPAVSGTPTFLSPSQATDAANYLAANWAKAVG